MSSMIQPTYNNNPNGMNPINPYDHYQAWLRAVTATPNMTPDQFFRLCATMDCFVAGTLVHTRTGLKRIENITLGEEVLSWNESSNQFEYRPVTNLIRTSAKQLVEIRGNDWQVTCSREHPFLSGNHTWIEAEDISEGHSLLCLRNSSTKVLSVRSILSPEPVQLYNLEVGQAHTYCVTEAGLVVDNLPCASWTAPLFTLGKVLLP